MKALAWVFLAMAAAPVATAQLSSEGGPIRIAAELGEIYDEDRRVVFTGEVDVAQGDARLQCDRMVVLYKQAESAAARAPSAPSENFGEIDSIVCTGDVFYAATDIKAESGKATYEKDTDTITLEERVTLLRNGNVARGELLVFQVGAGESTLTAGAAGRVRNILNPNETRAQQSQDDEVESE